MNRLESTFVIAMEACGDTGELENTLDLMGDMCQNGVVPMEIIYITA